MRKALRTSILLLTLSGAAYAGNIPCDNPTPPPAPATASVTAEPTSGEPVDAQATGITVADIALSVLQSALSVF